MLVLLPLSAFSQTFRNLEVNKKYKIILFDEKEYIGTLISQDDKSITLRTGNILVIIEKDNILKISKDISPSRFHFLTTAGAGISPHSSDGNSDRSGISFNGRFSYFYSEKKTIGIEITHSHYNPSPQPDQLRIGGETNNYNILINAQFGTFDKNSLADIYLNLGAGATLRKRNSITTTYYSSFDSTYRTYTTPADSRIHPLFQLGAGLILKPIKNIGINLELNLNTYGFGFFIFPQYADFPMRAGLTYYILR